MQRRNKIVGEKKRKELASLFASACFASSLLFLLLLFAEKMQHLVLDRDVRDWVLVPLTLCIALMMLMRQYATVSVVGVGQVFDGGSSTTDEIIALDAASHQSSVSTRF